MAIADRLNKLRTDIEDTYQSINNLGGTIPSDKNTNNIPEAIESIYSRLPKVTNTGTNVSLSPTLKGRLGIVPKGNTLQNGTPTPDTPVEIQSATGTQKVVVSGKNLFDKNGNFTYGNGLDKTSLNLNGQIVSTSNFSSVRSKGQLVENLTANTNYCVSGTLVSANGTATNNALIQILNTSNNQIEIKTFASSLTKPYDFYFTFNTGTNTSIWISFNGYNNSSTGSTETIFDNIQLEQGTTPTPYQPYITPQEVDIELSSRNKLPTNKDVWESGQYTTTGEKQDYPTRMRLKDLLPVNSNTTYSVLTNSNEIYFIIRTFDKNKNYLGNIGAVQNNATFSTNSDVAYLGVSVELFYSDYIENTNKLAIFLNDEINKNWVPYYNYTPNKIGDYEDYIDGTPDNWVLYKKIGKVVLDGSETGGSVGTNSKGIKYYYRNISTKINGGSVLSNNFQQVSSLWTLANYTNCIVTETNNKIVGIMTSDSTITDLNGFNNFFSSHNTEIMYPLANETTEPITDTNLISQLNELYYLMSYDDTTNIDVTGNLPMRITASAIKGA